MDTLTWYQTGSGSVNSPVTGQYLSRARLTRRERDFVSADLYRGVKFLVQPTLAQAAFLAGSNVSAVWWACHREEFRDEIIRGQLPLVPPLALKPIPDTAVVSFVRHVGISRMLDAAVVVEAAQ